MGTGERLKALREAAGLTLEEAGKIAGTTKQSTSQIEKGVTKVPGGLFLYRWGKYYNVNLEWLITGKGDQSPALSQVQRPDPAILSAAVELGRKSLLALDDDTFDPEHDGEIVAQAYMYLLARGQSKVTPSNVLDFAKALEKRQGRHGGTERTARTGEAGGAGGGASKARRQARAKAAAGSA